MSITYPLTFIDEFPGWSTEFMPSYRQEQSRVTSGRTYVKELGSPLWEASMQSRILTINEMDYWRAKIETLENGMQTFRSWPTSRYYPIAYPKGSWPTGSAFNGVGAVAGINANRKAISASGFPTGFKFSVGDLIQIGGADLHRVVEAGTTGEFEIRPHLWPGVSAGAAITVIKPSCLMAIVPDSVTASVDVSTGEGTLAFKAMEAR